MDPVGEGRRLSHTCRGSHPGAPRRLFPSPERFPHIPVSGKPSQNTRPGIVTSRGPAIAWGLAIHPPAEGPCGTVMTVGRLLTRKRWTETSSDQGSSSRSHGNRDTGRSTKDLRGSGCFSESSRPLCSSYVFPVAPDGSKSIRVCLFPWR